MRRRSEEAALVAGDPVQGFRFLQDRLRNEEIGIEIGFEPGVEIRVEAGVEIRVVVIGGQERIEIRFEE